MPDNRRQLILDYKNAFETEGGKRVLADLKILSKFDFAVSPIDNQGRIDPYMVLRNEGKRAVIIHIERKIKDNPNEDKQKGAIND